ncbi:MAG: putative cytochrome c [Acidobacteria bacterium]|nr:putative cytochrome c [Acidobacteriota bacterium]
MKTTTSLLLAALAFLSLTLSGQPTAALVLPQNPLTPEERRGKQIYVFGTSPQGREIVASVGNAGLEVPANVMACANCHGIHGQGKPEGSIRPSNLTWASLSRPDSDASSPKRIHPAYTDQSLAAAITQGTDPAGNRLRNVMPRFQISADDLADLIAYLKRLGNDRDPGVSDNKIVIGTILPKGSLAVMGQSIKAVLTAYFSEVNSQGGIYNRSIDFKFVETADTPAATRTAVEHFLQSEQVFALTGAFVAGSEKDIVTLMDQQDVPLIGPLTLYPQTGEPLNRQVFYLLSGLREQARALIDFAAKQAGPKKTGVTIVYPRTDLNLGTIETIREQSQKDVLSAPQVYEYATGHFDPAEAVKRLRQSTPDAVFFLGSSEEALAFLREAEKLSWFPSIYGPAAAAGSAMFEAPVGFDRKIFISFPTSPADQSAAGTHEFQALTEKYKLPQQNLAVQISIYSAAKVLVEGLKLAGKDLSREGLIRSLEGLREYQTGLTPPLTYGPDRRIGALGAYVITIDLKAKKFVSASDWIAPN